MAKEDGMSNVNNGTNLIPLIDDVSELEPHVRKRSAKNAGELALEDCRQKSFHTHVREALKTIGWDADVETPNANPKSNERGEQ
jgi:hypothetical protein